MENDIFKEQLHSITANMSRANNLYSRWAKANGINYNALLIFYVLHAKASVTQKQICDEYFIPKQSINNVIPDLIDRGLISFKPVPDDKRGKIIALTAKGRRYADNLLSPLFKIEASVLEKMGESLTNQLILTTSLFSTLLEKEMSDS